LKGQVQELGLAQEGDPLRAATGKELKGVEVGVAQRAENVLQQLGKN
jgi:hypothetical protein